MGQKAVRVAQRNIGRGLTYKELVEGHMQVRAF